MTAMFRTALASDPQGLIDVIDMALHNLAVAIRNLEPEATDEI